MWILEATTRSTRFTCVWTLLPPTSSNVRCYHMAVLVVIKLNSPPSAQIPTTTNSDHLLIFSIIFQRVICVRRLMCIDPNTYMCSEPSDARRFFLIL
ncbi:hypothetical protein RHGRI_033960 [Rhododendron griersonianum]|uniref:Uncharacterized protein n=1 Tax=Rhododendron griersonianum TaxID=479676 RepID=A0AAV6I381_9ERIC|nr:hypothetical protein RHGRI_033960 [Rhododendron griersonianum]